MPYAEVRDRAAFRRARESHCVDPGRTPERGRVIILPRRVDDPPELGHGLTPIWTVSPRKAYVCRRDLSAQRGSTPFVYPDVTQELARGWAQQNARVDEAVKLGCPADGGRIVYRLSPPRNAKDTYSNEDRRQIDESARQLAATAQGSRPPAASRWAALRRSDGGTTVEGGREHRLLWTVNRIPSISLNASAPDQRL